MESEQTNSAGALWGKMMTREREREREREPARLNRLRECPREFISDTISSQ